MIVEKIIIPDDKEEGIIFFKDIPDIIIAPIPAYPENTILELGVGGLYHGIGIKESKI